MWRYALSRLTTHGHYIHTFFFRSEGEAELYTYLPLTEENKRRQKAIPPKSIEHPDYGFSVGRGAYCLNGAVGNWVALALRVKLNDFGVNNG